MRHDSLVDFRRLFGSNNLHTLHCGFCRPVHRLVRKFQHALPIAGKHFNHVAVGIEREDVEGLRWRAFYFHAGRTYRHPRHRQPGDVFWAFFEQPFNIGGRDMTFNDIAIHDGCMAGLEFGRHPILHLDGGKIGNVFRFHIKAVFGEVGVPIATASSGRRFEDDSLDCPGRACLVWVGTRSPASCQEQGGEYANDQLSFHNVLHAGIIQSQMLHG